MAMKYILYFLIIAASLLLFSQSGSKQIFFLQEINSETINEENKNGENSQKYCIQTSNFKNAYDAITKIGFGTNNCDSCHPSGAPHFKIYGKDQIIIHDHINKDCDPPVSEKIIDRVRNEIISHHVTAKSGETWQLSWGFQLNSDFKETKRFTHLHQLKLDGAGTGDPTFTVSAVKGQLQLESLDGPLHSEPLNKFLGKNINVKYTVELKNGGTIDIQLTSGGSNLLSWSGKVKGVGDGPMAAHWGLYRGKDTGQQDEQMILSNICFNKM